MLNKNKNVPQREVHLTLATSEEVVVPFWSSQRAMVRFVISENGFKRFGCSLRNKRRIVRAPVESAGHRGGHTLNPESQMSHGSSDVRVCPPQRDRRHTATIPTMRRQIYQLRGLYFAGAAVACRTGRANPATVTVLIEEERFPTRFNDIVVKSNE